jgi:hypothetical protein
MMQKQSHVRSLTTNFSFFQGLKGIPLGLLLMVLSIWASAQTAPGPALFFPIGSVVVLLGLYWIVYRFYQQVFGVVVQAKRRKTASTIREGLIGAAALAAFWIDTSLSISISVLGLIFAGAMLVDYGRVPGKTGNRLLWFYPAGALLMLSLSLIPFFNLTWWETLGFKALLYGITAAAGMLFIILGVATHIALENLFVEIEEAEGE